MVTKDVSQPIPSPKKHAPLSWIFIEQNPNGTYFIMKSLAIRADNAFFNVPPTVIPAASAKSEHVHDSAQAKSGFSFVD